VTFVVNVFWNSSKVGSQRAFWRAWISSDILGLTGFIRGPAIPELATAYQDAQRADQGC